MLIILALSSSHANGMLYLPSTILSVLQINMWKDTKVHLVQNAHTSIDAFVVQNPKSLPTSSILPTNFSTVSLLVKQFTTTLKNFPSSPGA